MRRAIWVLWPSFIVGGIAETVFFTFFDPMELHLFGEPAGMSRLAVYSAGFFLFWAFAAASSAFTCFLQRSPGEINVDARPSPSQPAARPNSEDHHATS